MNKNQKYLNALEPHFEHILVENKSNNLFYKTQLNVYENSFTETNGIRNEVNHIFKLLSRAIFNLFKCYYNYQNSKNEVILNDICLLEIEIKGLLSNFEALNLEIKKSHELKHYAIDEFERFKVFVKFSLFIDIDASPLKKKFKRTYDSIKDIQVRENTQPQQTETDELDGFIEKKMKLHNHIFKGNAFEVWQSMYDEFGIKSSSRTDVKFMFEEMKKDGLIHNTVNQTDFLDWIAQAYDGLVVQKISNHSRTISRLQAYSRAKILYKP